MRWSILAAYLLLQLTSAKAHVHYGFQSGAFSASQTDEQVGRSEDDHSYASSLHFDSENNLLFVTGGTYSRYWDGASRGSYLDIRSHLEHSDCFMTVLKVPKQSNGTGTSNSADTNESMKIVYARRFGTESVPEACSAVTFMNYPSSKAKALTVGHTTEGGILTSLRQPGSQHSSVYGVVLDLDLDIHELEDEVSGISGRVDGGKLIHDMPVQYPVAVTSDPLSTFSKDIYVASLTSMSRQENPSPPEVTHPDMTAGGGLDDPRYGADFRVIVEMMSPKSQELIDYELSQREDDDAADEGGVMETISGGWKRSFSPQRSLNDPDPDNDPFTSAPYVQISDLVYIPRRFETLTGDGVLILAGTTDGYGPDFGGNQLPEDGFSNDGFITKLNPKDGKLDFSNASGVGISKGSRSIGTPISQDYIKGVCFQKNLEGVEYVYVVGYTDGQMDNTLSQSELTKRPGTDDVVSFHAFVSMVNIDTLDVIWTRQFGTANGKDIIGYGCDVTHDGDTIYLGGTVLDGDHIKSSYGNPATTSAGGDDVFIASISAVDGQVKYTNQFGTKYEDSLAKANGVTSDNSGDAILVGNTKGSFMRYRGADYPLDEVDGVISPRNDPYDVFVLSVDKTSGETRPSAENTKMNIDLESPGGGDSDSSDSGSMLMGIEIFSIVVGSIVIFAVLLYAGRRYRSGGNGLNKMDYLEDFDDADVDVHVRHSATGGVHGYYEFGKRFSKDMESDTSPPGEIAIDDSKPPAETFHSLPPVESLNTSTPNNNSGLGLAHGNGEGHSLPAPGEEESNLLSSNEDYKLL